MMVITGALGGTNPLPNLPYDHVWEMLNPLKMQGWVKCAKHNIWLIRQLCHNTLNILMQQMLHFNIFTMPCAYSCELWPIFYSASKFDCISGSWKVSDFIISGGSMPSNQTDFQILHWRGAKYPGGRWARGCAALPSKFYIQ